MAGPLDPAVSTTIAYYARDVFDGVKENFAFWKNINDQGKLIYDQGGDPIVQPLAVGRYRPIISAPGMDLSQYATSVPRHLRSSLAFGEVTVTTRFDRGLLRRNSGNEALVDLSSTEIPQMVEDIVKGPGFTANSDGSLSWQILNTAGQSYSGGGLPIYGLPSFLLAPGATGLNGFNPDTKVVSGIAPVAADREVVPTSTSATYAGWSMAYNGLSATVTQAEPDAYTPTLVNLGSSVWTGTQQQYNLAIANALNWTVERTCRFDNTDPTYRGTFGMLSSDYFRFLGEFLAGKQTIYMQPMQTDAIDSPNMGYAPRNRLRHADLWFYYDYNMPAATAYVINGKQLKICFQKLFKDGVFPSPLAGITGEDAGIVEPIVMLDPLTRSYIVNLTIPAQMLANPRYHGRLGNFF